MNEKQEEKAKELINFINYTGKKQFTYSNKNCERICEALNVEDKDEFYSFKNFVNKYENFKDKKLEISKICEDYELKKYEEIQKEKEARINKEINLNSSISTLEQAMAKVFIEAKKDLIKEELTDKIFEQAKQKIEEEYGTIYKKTILETEDKEIDFGDEVLHEKFDTILKFVKQNEPVFLVGEAGTGKNYICKQVAKALGLDFYFSNAVTQEYKLTGFTDAMGKYQESEFYKAFKNGGLFMLDEIDASIPEVLVILNAAIANKYFDFPAPIGYVEAHPDFRVVAAGNTIGQGASYTYVGRNQLDGASLDRFAMVNIDYDINIETRCANNDVELVNFIREVRRVAKERKIMLIVSYRSITRIAKMKDLIGLKEALKTCLFKDLNMNELYQIMDNIICAREYRNATEEIYQDLKKKEENSSRYEAC